MKCAAGDLDARNLLIEHNLRLVAHVIKKYYAMSKDQDDLISIGTIGLIKAISSFDPSKGAKLATYAARCIENAMLSQWPGFFSFLSQIPADNLFSKTHCDKNPHGKKWAKGYRCSPLFFFDQMDGQHDRRPKNGRDSER